MIDFTAPMMLSDPRMKMKIAAVDHYKHRLARFRRPLYSLGEAAVFAMLFPAVVMIVKVLDGFYAS